MQKRGIIKQIFFDFMQKKTLVTLEIDGDAREILQELIGKDIDAELKKHREKRSLDANAYFHLLVSRIAEKTQISKDRAKNILLCRYGQYEFQDGSIPTYLVKSEYDDKIMERSDIHMKAIGSKVVDDEEFTKWTIMRGSHTYDTKEMSVLIEGTIQEAKQLGIETITPDEQRKMLQKWGLKIGKAA